MSTCRACSNDNRGNQRKAVWSGSNLKRADSRMLANKLRYFVLKNIDSCPKQSRAPFVDPKVCISQAGTAECLSVKEYKILEMIDEDEMDQKLSELSLEDLESIVSRECKDVSCALTMARKNNMDIWHREPTDEAKPLCRQETGNILTRTCDTDEDISADVVAKMLHAAEIKSALTAPPEVIYNLLFDDPEFKPLPVNTAAYDTMLSDVVVPLGPPADLNADPDLADTQRLSANITDDSSVNSEVSGASRELQSHIIQKVFDQSDEPVSLKQLLHGPQDIFGDFEFLIEPQEPKYKTLAQLRGSVRPSWFPDYYALFPDSPYGNFEKMGNPMEVLERAWEHVQPAGMKPNEGIQLIGL